MRAMRFLPRPPAQGATVTETVAALQGAGFNRQYGVSDCWVCDERSGQRYGPQQFAVEATYRFEGDTDPDDEEIVLALENVQTGQRGVLVTAYGATASAGEGRVLEGLLDWRARD